MSDDGRSDPRADEGPSTAGDGTIREDATNDGTADDWIAGEDPPAPRDLLDTFLTAREGPAMVLREMLVSVAIVAVVGLLLFALSGIWPPMVAVESGSMEPHMHRGDLVFVSEPGRYVPDATHGATGVITRTDGARIGYRSFGDYGSVIVYDSPDKGGAPVIHRARFWVEEGENWYHEADPAYHSAGSCEELPNCPAPHDGFITKGDANTRYDQVIGISEPVRPGWVVGLAQVRIPYLGYVRLWLVEGSNAPLVVEAGNGTTVGPGATGAAAASGAGGSGQPSNRAWTNG